MSQYLAAASRLHHYIVNTHWDGQAIVGPDPIGKINWRITRFARSYTRWLPWPANLVYLQGQSYWIDGNLRLVDLLQDESYLETVEGCADYIVQKQLSHGVWLHPPLRERRGFISVVESVWACLGLVAAYKKLNGSRYLDAILKGYEGIINVIGMSPYEDSLGINYYAHSKVLVPNVTTMFLWLVAEIYQLTGDRRYLNHTGEMIRFLQYAQMENGELQYIFQYRPHFQCYQYNSFQFLDLANYYELTRDQEIWKILEKMATFLAGGMTQRGSSRYNCFKENPEVNYWTGALAAALDRADELGLGNYLSLSAKGFAYLRTKQRSDGGFGYSKYNYKILQDHNAYPRYLAMILNQLLRRVQTEIRVIQ